MTVLETAGSHDPAAGSGGVRRLHSAQRPTPAQQQWRTEMSTFTKKTVHDFSTFPVEPDDPHCQAEAAVAILRNDILSADEVLAMKPLKEDLRHALDVVTTHLRECGDVLAPLLPGCRDWRVLEEGIWIGDTHHTSVTEAMLALTVWAGWNLGLSLNDWDVLRSLRQPLDAYGRCRTYVPRRLEALLSWPFDTCRDCDDELHRLEVMAVQEITWAKQATGPRDNSGQTGSSEAGRSISAEQIEATADEGAAETPATTSSNATTKKRRPAYDRDHLWLRWYEEEKLTPAKIRVRWIRMDPKNKVSREVVIEGLKKARREKK
jgi:hypothetical protein